MGFLIDYHKNLCWIHAGVIVATMKNPYKTVISTLSHFIFMKKSAKSLQVIQ